MYLHIEQFWITLFFIWFRHDFLLLHGASNRKAVVTNKNENGASQEELTNLVMATYPDLQPRTSVIVQAWDKEFDEFVDITKDDVIKGPPKIRVNQLLSVEFSPDVLEIGGLQVHLCRPN